MTLQNLEYGKEYEIKHTKGLLANDEEKLIEKTNKKLLPNRNTDYKILEEIENHNNAISKMLDKHSKKNIVSDRQKLNKKEIIGYITALIGLDRKDQFNKPELKGNKLILSRKGGTDSDITLDTTNLGTIRESLLSKPANEIAGIIQRNRHGSIIFDGKRYPRPNTKDFVPEVELVEVTHEQINNTETLNKEKSLMNLADLFSNGSSEISPNLIETIKTTAFQKFLNTALNNRQKIIIKGQVNNTNNAQKDSNKEGLLSENRGNAVKAAILNSVKNKIRKDALDKSIVVKDGGIGGKGEDERRVDIYTE